MKEILKYLRQTNSYTQEQIAKKLEISRQSYIKYENGDIIPNEKVIRKLSIIYDVKEEFIKENKIPKLQNKKEVNYNLDNKENEFSAAEPTFTYGGKKTLDGRRILEGIFDGTVVRILDSLDSLNIKKGQTVKLYIENEEEEMQRRQAAFDRFMAIAKKGKVCNLPEDKDPYYKEMIAKEREEKYGSID